MAAKAVGLADHKRMLEDHARRVRESHRAGMEALGHPVAEPDAEGDDMGGDVFVCGDITTTTQQESGYQNDTPIPTTSRIWPYVLAAALGSGGLGLGAASLINLLGANTEPPAAVVAPDTDTDTQYELRISSGE